MKSCLGERVLVQMDQRLPATKNVVRGAQVSRISHRLSSPAGGCERPLDGLTRGEQLAWLAENRSKKALTDKWIHLMSDYVFAPLTLLIVGAQY